MSQSEMFFFTSATNKKLKITTNKTLQLIVHMDAFIAADKVSAEQEFMLMLFDRVEKLEKQLQDITEHNTPPHVSMALYKHFQKIGSESHEKRINGWKKSLSEKVPEHILVKVPVSLYSLLRHILDCAKDINTGSLWNVENSICGFLGKFQDADKEFIDWFSQTLGVRLDI